MVVRARTIFIMAAALLLVSCHKEICYDHHHAGQHLQVIFDWGELDPTTVHGMTLLLYPEDGSAPLRFPFADIQGGTISVTSGTYNALCVNDDELLHLQGEESWETVSVTTGETGLVARAAFNNTKSDIPRAQGSEEEPVLREPPLLYTATRLNFYVKAAEETQILRLAPQMPLGQIYVRVEAVENARFLETLSGVVTGLSSSLSLTTLEPSDDHCTMPVNLTLTEDGYLEGWLNYFGHCPTTELPHSLAIYTMLIDTSKQANIYDITEQMHPGEGKEEDKNHEVIIPVLPLPTPEPAEGGFDINLDEWNTTSIEIKM